MIRIKALQRAVMFAVVVYLALTVPLSAGMMKVASEQTVTTFKYPESIAYDPEAKVLYVSEFGSQLNPTLKDGKGRISKVSLNGKVLEETFLPASGKSINPNGLYPAQDGSLLMVGFKSQTEARAIYTMAHGKDPKALSKEIGRLDGLYQTGDGVLLVTEWNSGSLFSWTAKTEMKTLASGFKGPADFCAYPNAGNLMVVVPDLVKSELRMVQLEK